MGVNCSWGLKSTPRPFLGYLAVTAPGGGRIPDSAIIQSCLHMTEAKINATLIKADDCSAFDTQMSKSKNNSRLHK